MESTHKSVEDFSESISFDVRLWKHDIQGSIAHCRMLARQGIISKSDPDKIIRGLNKIAADIESGSFTFDQALEDVHMNIEAALIRGIGPVGGRLHTARSRNDQVALDLRLYLRDEADSLMALLREFQSVLINKADRYIDCVMPGYTHMQRAQPVLLSHHLLAYVEMLERDMDRLKDCRRRTDVMPLGSGAMAGTSLPIDRRFTARELGFKSISQNSIDAVSDRDFAIEFVFACSMIMMHLSRLSEELVLWSSTEFAFLILPDAFATGSSIMPQKKNPDVPELIRGKTGRVYGGLITLLTIMKGLPLAYNRDMQEDKPPVFDAIDTVKGCLGVLIDMMGAVGFNRDRMKSAATEGFSAATDIAEYLVKQGMPFRQAHEITGRIVAYCIAENKVLEDLTHKEFQGFSKLFKRDILTRLSATASVNSRRSEGGTAPSNVKSRIKSLKARIKK